MGRWHLEFEMGRRSRSVTLSLVLCIALACVVAGILLITLPNALASRESHEYDYGLIIDAGSSGSRIYLYTWPHRKSARTPTVSSLNDPSTNTSLALKILPGLQSYQVRRCLAFHMPQERRAMHVMHLFASLAVCDPHIVFLLLALRTTTRPRACRWCRWWNLP